MLFRLLAPPLLCLLLGTVPMLGCTKSGKTEVYGQVLLNGKPIDDGDISFYPDQGTAAAQSSAPIKSGNYRLSPEWGLVAGAYQVRINAYREPTNKSKMLAGGALDKPPETPGIPSREQFLPKKFNADSTIEKLVVTAGQAKIKQDYDLQP
jgi:hypothetical protein